MGVIGGTAFSVGGLELGPGEPGAGADPLGPGDPLRVGEPLGPGASADEDPPGEPDDCTHVTALFAPWASQLPLFVAHPATTNARQAERAATGARHRRLAQRALLMGRLQIGHLSIGLYCYCPALYSCRRY